MHLPYKGKTQTKKEFELYVVSYRVLLKLWVMQSLRRVVCSCGKYEKYKFSNSINKFIGGHSLYLLISHMTQRLLKIIEMFTVALLNG